MEQANPDGTHICYGQSPEIHLHWKGGTSQGCTPVQVDILPTYILLVVYLPQIQPVIVSGSR